MKILVLDNYDSFTFNLVHILEKLEVEQIDVVRNDKVKMDLVGQYDKILLSPGPGLPKDSGLCVDLIREYGKIKSILGVCLGHQAIAEVFGAKLCNMDQVQHGIKSTINIVYNNGLYDNLPTSIDVGRYHSWVVDDKFLPDCLRITAVDEFGQIMGLCHNKYNIQGVQFHPESIMTSMGEEMLKNWLHK